MFMITIFSPAVRLVPSYCAQRANQAAWLSPLPAIALFSLLVLVWQSIYKKQGDKTMMDIYCDITGKIPGVILTVFYLIWLILLIALYVQYSSFKFVVSVYPNMSVSIFSISLLAGIAYTLRCGLTTLARLGEIVHPALVGVFIVLVILMLPNLKQDMLMPISYRSILPVLEGSVSIIGLVSYFSFVFILGDRINNKQAIRKTGLQTAVFFVIVFTVLIAITIGTFSSSVVARTQLPFLIAVKQISLFNTLEKIESIVVAIWVASDFVLISLFSLCALHIMKLLFNLSNTKHLISIFLVMIYIISAFFSDNLFELQKLSEILFLPGNILMGFIIPIFIFVIGKIRKKV
ncbi:MAG: GerAB/ArcD/ProY family transporter [Ruminiclostridium sp.]|nr:GerAB/ArcD/ProY family transporter [Ruminiclostridium sp.]